METDGDTDNDSDESDRFPNWTEDLQEIDVAPFIQTSGLSHNLPPTAEELAYV